MARNRLFFFVKKTFYELFPHVTYFLQNYKVYYGFLFESKQKLFNPPQSSVGMILFSLLIYQLFTKTVTLSFQQQTLLFVLFLVLTITTSLSKNYKLFEFWFSAYLYHKRFFREWLFFYMYYENKMQRSTLGKWLGYSFIFLVYSLYSAYRPGTVPEYIFFFLLFSLVANNVFYYRIRKSFINHYHLKIPENVCLEWRMIEDALNAYCGLFAYQPILLKKLEQFPHITRQGFFAKNHEELETYVKTVDINKLTAFAFTLPVMIVFLQAFFRLTREITEYCIEMENLDEKIQLSSAHIDAIKSDLESFFPKDRPKISSIEKMKEDIFKYETEKNLLLKQAEYNRNFYCWTHFLLRPLLEREFRGREKNYLKHLDDF